jgi:hypothetical protein
MRWYDYVICFLFADIIAGGILTANLLAIGIGVMGYEFYEGFRKSLTTK